MTSGRDYEFTARHDRCAISFFSCQHNQWRCLSKLHERAADSGGISRNAKPHQFQISVEEPVNAFKISAMQYSQNRLGSSSSRVLSLGQS